MACKSVTIYRRRHDRSQNAGDAFAQGFARHGLGARVAEADVEDGSDLAVLWSVKWPAVIADRERSGRPYLVLERGIVDRANVSAGYNGLKAAADYGLPAEAPAARPITAPDINPVPPG